MSTDVVMTIPVSNTGSSSKTLCLEPIGDTLEMPPGERYELVLIDPEDPVLRIEKVGAELVFQDDLVILFTSAHVEVWKDGERIRY